MDFSRRFTFLFCAPGYDDDELEGVWLTRIIKEVEKLGFQLARARKFDDAEIAIRADAAIGCIVIDWGKKGMEGKAAALIAYVRRRGLQTPVVLVMRRTRLENIPVEVLNEIDGYVFVAEETPEFIAKNLASRIKQYAEMQKTPFFGELVDYNDEGNQLWRGGPGKSDRMLS